MFRYILKFIKKLKIKDGFSCKKIEEKFVSEFLNNSFFQELPNQIEHNLKLSIRTQYELYKETLDKIYIYNAIKTFYLVKWLYEKQYGDKLNLKYTSLIYVDDYGDRIFKKAEAEIKNFVKNHLLQLINAVDSNIDEFYIRCATKDNMKQFLLLAHLTGLNEDEIIENTTSDIIDVLDCFDEE